MGELLTVCLLPSVTLVNSRISAGSFGCATCMVAVPVSTRKPSHVFRWDMCVLCQAMGMPSAESLLAGGGLRVW